MNTYKITTYAGKEHLIRAEDATAAIAMLGPVDTYAGVESVELQEA